MRPTNKALRIRKLIAKGLSDDQIARKIGMPGKAGVERSAREREICGPGKPSAAKLAQWEAEKVPAADDDGHLDWLGSGGDPDKFS